MKIILLENVKKQGNKGQIIEVTPGYGTFLINNKKAVPATQTSVNRLSKEKSEAALNEALEIKEMKKLKEKLEKTNIKIKVKTGVSDRVFGSVSSKQITNQLKNNNINIDKKKITLDHELASLGFHDVKINLHKKVIATLKVELIKEG